MHMWLTWHVEYDYCSLKVANVVIKVVTGEGGVFRETSSWECLEEEAKMVIFSLWCGVLLFIVVRRVVGICVCVYGGGGVCGCVWVGMGVCGCVLVCVGGRGCVGVCGWGVWWWKRMQLTHSRKMERDPSLSDHCSVQEQQITTTVTATTCSDHSLQSRWEDNQSHCLEGFGQLLLYSVPLVLGVVVQSVGRERLELHNNTHSESELQVLTTVYIHV